MDVIIYRCPFCEMHFSIEEKHADADVCCPICETEVIDLIGKGKLTID